MGNTAHVGASLPACAPSTPPHRHPAARRAHRAPRGVGTARPAAQERRWRFPHTMQANPGRQPPVVPRRDRRRADGGRESATRAGRALSEWPIRSDLAIPVHPRAFDSRSYAADLGGFVIGWMQMQKKCAPSLLISRSHACGDGIPRARAPSFVVGSGHDPWPIAGKRGEVGIQTGSAKSLRCSQPPRSGCRISMRPASIFCLLSCLAAMLAPAQQKPAQQAETAPPTLTVQSTLVLAPVLVKTRGGQVIFGLTADDFLLTDNGARPG